MKRRRVAAAAVLPVLLALSFARGEAASSSPQKGSGVLEGFRLVDATAASVNGEILFLSDVAREACFEQCGAFAGEPPVDAGLSEARKKLVYNRLVLQEQRKLSLGAIDNDAFASAFAEAKKRLAACSYPCALELEDKDVRTYVTDRILVAGFLDKRVSVFIEVPDEEVQLTINRRASTEGKDPGSYSEEAVRADLRREKSELEVRNWFYKAAANARIFMSPMEEK